MSQNCESLEGLAWQYVSGELDAAAEAAFEERLLVDLTACEAVAAAQGVRSLVQRTRTCPVPADFAPADFASAVATRGERRGGARLARWVTVSLVVAGVFGLALVWRPMETRPVASDLDVAVVAAWTAGAAALEDGVVPEEMELASQASSDLDIPGWLVTALEHAEKNEDETMEN